MLTPAHLPPVDLNKYRAQFVKSLTSRQREIVAGVTMGFSNPQIARVLTIESRTVANRLTEVYAKLNPYDRYIPNYHCRPPRMNIVFFLDDYLDTPPWHDLLSSWHQA